MTDEDLTPLDADVARVLGAERGVPEPTAETKARMLAAVSARLGLPPDGGDDGGGSTGSAPSPPRSGIFSRWRAGAVVAAAFALGVAARSAFPPEARVVFVDRTPDVPAAPAASSGPAPPVAAPEPTPAPARPSASPEPDNKGLAAERALLDVARTALAGGDPARALTAIARHEKAYPNGLLVEEREALAVKALAAAGRADEARARGARFAKRFPNGLMRPAVEGALQSLGPP